MKVTHFHSMDVRFCRSKEKFRHFSLLDEEVTCPTCRDHGGLPDLVEEDYLKEAPQTSESPEVQA